MGVLKDLITRRKPQATQQPQAVAAQMQPQPQQTAVQPQPQQAPQPQQQPFFAMNMQGAQMPWSYDGMVQQMNEEQPKIAQPQISNDPENAPQPLQPQAQVQPQGAEQAAPQSDGTIVKSVAPPMASTTPHIVTEEEKAAQAQAEAQKSKEGDKGGLKEGEKEGQQKSMTYEQMFKQLHPELDPKLIEAERKRQKRNALFAALGDGISALADLHYTTKMAPNSDLRPYLSDAAAKRKQKFDDDLNKWRDNYIQAYERAQAQDKAQAERDKALEWDKQKQDMANKRHAAGIAAQAAENEAKRKQAAEEAQKNREAQAAINEANNKARAKEGAARRASEERIAKGHDNTALEREKMRQKHDLKIAKARGRGGKGTNQQPVKWNIGRNTDRIITFKPGSLNDETVNHFYEQLRKKMPNAIGLEDVKKFEGLTMDEKIASIGKLLGKVRSGQNKTRKGGSWNSDYDKMMNDWANTADMLNAGTDEYDEGDWENSSVSMSQPANAAGGDIMPWMKNEEDTMPWMK